MQSYYAPRYGKPDVLQLRQVERPDPADDQVLVRVQAASLNKYDWHLLTADIFLVRLGSGLLRPKFPVPGADMSGVVEAVGSQVSQFKPGDAVFGDIGKGAFAEYALARPGLLALKPEGMSFEQAAALPMAGLTALQGLRDHGQLQAGQKVLIHGAGGGVGTFAVQIARALGAEVTAVCGPANVEMARSLGAAKVIDYTKEDVAELPQVFDLVMAVNGFRSIYTYQRLLAPGGRYIMAGGSVRQLFEGLLLGPRLSKSGQVQMKAFTARLNQADLEVLKDLFASGKLKPVIERVYPFAELPIALATLGAGHARGKLVITVGPQAA